MNLIGLDYLGISQYFSDEELLVQKSCREFVDNEVLPIIEKHFKEGTFPNHLIKKFGDLGFLGMNLLKNMVVQAYLILHMDYYVRSLKEAIQA